CGRRLPPVLRQRRGRGRARRGTPVLQPGAPLTDLLAFLRRGREILRHSRGSVHQDDENTEEQGTHGSLGLWLPTLPDTGVRTGALPLTPVRAGRNDDTGRTLQRPGMMSQ